MKKYIFLILLLIIIILLIIFCYVYFQEKVELIDAKEEKICSTSKLKEYNNYNIYSYCLDEMYIITNKDKYDIMDFLVSHDFNEILDLFEVYTTAYDGGSVIYTPSTSSIFKNESILIVDCNNKQFNNDNIYIIPESTDIDIEICQQNNY